MQPSPELREIIVGWFKAVTQGDTKWVERHVSRQAGTRLVGTDPGEWLQAGQAADFLSHEAESMAGQVQFSVADAEAYREGAVGWGVARPTITLPNGKEIKVRWSAVFHQEGGEWKAVQIHASAGVSNETLFEFGG